MYVCLTCELVIPTVLRAYVGVCIYETAYVRRYEVCIAYVTLRTYVLYVCLDSYSHCPVSCSLLSWLKRKTIIFLCCQERRRRRGWHSINALMVGVTPSVCLWCVVAVCGTHMSTLSPFVCVYVPWCILACLRCPFASFPIPCPHTHFYRSTRPSCSLNHSPIPSVSLL